MSNSVGERTFARQLAAVRSAPRADAEQVTQVLPGEPVAVAEERDGWARVCTAYDYPGWVLVSELGGEADPRWLEPQSSDPLEWARRLLGTPYLWGGMTGHGIDCSGLVHMSYRALGRLVPRDADQQEEAGTEVPEADLRPGDLVTYGSQPGGPATHVAFWLGDGRILHSTERDGANGVLEEPEPEDLRARRRKLVRLASNA
jgi:gamma-D-glutamyl-L-lysine dipeptidyl-peptidase